MNEDIDLFEEDKKIIGSKLPEFVNEWLIEATKFSQYNEVPAAISCLVLIGQAVKDFVKIPRGKSIDDSRLHWIWVQDSGTGKTAIMDFVIPVSNILWEKINEVNNYRPTYVIENLQKEANEGNEVGEDLLVLPLERYDNFDVVEYTDAALLGYNEPYTDDEGFTRYRQYKGEIDGNGLARWDEFTNSGVFKQSQHKESIVTYLNTLCNSLGGSSWKITKKLKEGPLLVCLSQRSILATTFPPEQLEHALVATGLFQRALMTVRHVPEEIQDKIRDSIVDAYGTVEEINLPIERFARGLFKIYETTKEQYENTATLTDDGKPDATKTITFSKEFNDTLRMRKNDMNGWSDNTEGKVREIAKNFQTRWLGLLGKISVLCCIAEANSIQDKEKRFVVNGRNVNQAAFIVRNCYKSLIEWLEQSLKVSQKAALNQNDNTVAFLKCYEKLDKDEEGYIGKTALLAKVMQETKLSQPQIYRTFRKIEKHWETKKIGKTVFVRLKRE